MKKIELKQILEDAKKRDSKLMFVRHLCNNLNCSLFRAKKELLDNLLWEAKFNKEFNKLWSLLTKEEKSYLKYKAK